MGDDQPSQQTSLDDHVGRRRSSEPADGRQALSEKHARPGLVQQNSYQETRHDQQQHQQHQQRQQQHQQHQQQPQPQLQLQPQQQQQHSQQQQQYQQYQYQQYNPNLRPGYPPPTAVVASRGGYDMSSMENTLPKVDYRAPRFNAGNQRFNPAANTNNMPRQIPVPLSPYGSQVTAQNTPVNQPFYIPSTQYYSNAVPTMHPTANNMSPRPGYGYYPAGPMPPSGPFYYAPPGQNRPMAGMVGGGYPQPNYGQTDSRGLGQPQPPVLTGGGGMAVNTAGFNQGQGETRTSNIVRGPPRKPRQSGHAIWIGNLPPQTDLMSLVHHVCRNTTGLESLFLISKSYCAFANFKDEQSCLAAHQKINETRFMSVRLVSRLRKNAAEGGARGQGTPASTTSPQTQKQSLDDTAEQPTTTTTTTTETDTETETDDQEEETKRDGNIERSDTMPVIVDGTASPGKIIDGTDTPEQVSGHGSEQDNSNNNNNSTSTSNADDTTHRQTDRFFILKSLTVEDLEQSVQTGIWATQSHNEAVLNEAYKTSDNVFLVFSANRSREYFGYAKMASEINEDPSAAIQFAPRSQQAFSEVELPRAIPTEATEYAPRGLIIDDSDRGTIFWEILRDESPESGSAVDGEGGGTIDGPDDSSSVKSEGGGGTGTATTTTTTTTTAPSADGSTTTMTAIKAGSPAAGTPTTTAASTDGTEPKAWGKPFRLEWQSTNKVTFFRTRGMRNPLNSNREIKIARDGTELDPAVGRRLIALFHQPVPDATPMAPVVSGYPPQPMMPSMPMRPPY